MTLGEQMERKYQDNTKFKRGYMVKVLNHPARTYQCEFIGEFGEIVKIVDSETPFKVLFDHEDSRGLRAWWFAENEIEIVKRYADEPAEEQTDVVNHPSHYNNGKIECIDAVESAVTGLQGMDAVCTGHIIRYIWRWKFKNGLEDLKKCRFYLDKLIAKVESK